MMKKGGYPWFPGEPRFGVHEKVGVKPPLKAPDFSREVNVFYTRFLPPSRISRAGSESVAPNLSKTV
jgi:hypothetical protein